MRSRPFGKILFDVSDHGSYQYVSLCRRPSGRRCLECIIRKLPDTLPLERSSRGFCWTMSLPRSGPSVSEAGRRGRSSRGGRRFALEPVALVAALDVVAGQDPVEVGLELADALVPGRPAGDAESLVEEAAVHPLDEARVAVLGGWVLNPLEGEQELVGALFRPFAELTVPCWAERLSPARPMPPIGAALGREADGAR